MSYPSMKSDRSERVAYDKADFPSYIRKGRLSFYPDYAVESHWHDDIELILILTGQMRYNVNGDVVLLNQGEGIFVNSRQLHFGFSLEKQECEFLCILLHPLLLCSSRTLEQRCVSPLLSDDTVPFCHLKPETVWGRDVLAAIQNLYEIRNDPLSELKIQRDFLDIWIHLCENVSSVSKAKPASNQNLSVLKNMISFLNDNFSEKLKLGEIANAGGVGKTSCCTIFKRYINKTPTEYLTELRLRKAIELLKNTDMTILEISYTVGFSSASYFAETFRKFYGRSPKVYRQQK